MKQHHKWAVGILISMSIYIPFLLHDVVWISYLLGSLNVIALALTCLEHLSQDKEKKEELIERVNEIYQDPYKLTYNILNIGLALTLGLFFYGLTTALLFTVSVSMTTSKAK